MKIDVTVKSFDNPQLNFLIPSIDNAMKGAIIQLADLEEPHIDISKLNTVHIPEDYQNELFSFQQKIGHTKFVTNINGKDITNRIPEVNIESLKAGASLNANYNHKKEAISEYENQIISFQNYYQIEHIGDIMKQPEIEEDSFNSDLFDYLAKVSKTIQDKGLKNKIKLIMK